MLDVLSKAFDAVGKTMGYLDTKASKEIQSKLLEKKQAILEERLKREQRDDAKLERLYAESALLMEAADREIELYHAKQ